MVTYTAHSKLTARSAAAGLTLIELMVALAIGMFLMIGAITVFMQGRTTFRITENVSRLQENGRFILDTLEPDIRMASYWGLTNLGTSIDGRTGASAISPSASLVTCGNNWTLDLARPVAGTNNTYSWGCGVPAGTGTAMANADTLVVRHASEDPVLAGRSANSLYVQSNRAQRSQLFQGSALPGSPNPTTSAPYRLIVNGYYVATNNTSSLSTAGNTVPSLRRRALVDNLIRDEEIMAGVEDFQVQFGIDTTDPDDDGRGAIDRFVNTDDAILTSAGFIANNGQIIAVRIWVRLRAERIENGFTDTATYVYADRNVGPFNDNFRRVVVSRTIYLRNANIR